LRGDLPDPAGFSFGAVLVKWELAVFKHHSRAASSYFRLVGDRERAIGWQAYA